jgi:hypothetical protein
MHLRLLTSNPGSRAWLRMAALMLIVCAADILALFYATRPVIYTAIIPALLPLLTVPVVILPLINERKNP